jgi:hypothetical protein
LTDYSCAVEAKILLHGRLYVTDKFVCFYSNFFGFEKKVPRPAKAIYIYVYHIYIIYIYIYIYIYI